MGAIGKDTSRTSMTSLIKLAILLERDLALSTKAYSRKVKNTQHVLEMPPKQIRGILKELDEMETHGSFDAIRAGNLVKKDFEKNKEWARKFNISQSELVAEVGRGMDKIIRDLKKMCGKLYQKQKRVLYQQVHQSSGDKSMKKKKETYETEVLDVLKAALERTAARFESVRSGIREGERPLLCTVHRGRVMRPG